MSLRGKQPNGLLTQQRVPRAAVALFLEKGYARTTTGEIARAAGIIRKTVAQAEAGFEALTQPEP